ncbi:unnamed protein product [Sphagnum jensenii]|uniref:Phosphoenolpyruvate carboxylase n=2 Tax=Sphagnum jensenii TaxID=128206 RepID=A0ABP0VJE7_9BRYO
MQPALRKMPSFDAQMRLLVPRKLSEDHKLVEYDALLLDRFLDILRVTELEETFCRLANQLDKTPVEIFEALKNQTGDLVFTAHPTQYICQSLLQKHSRFKRHLGPMKSEGQPDTTG